MRDDSSEAEPAVAVDDYEWVNVWAAQASGAAAPDPRVAPEPRPAVAHADDFHPMPSVPGPVDPVRRLPDMSAEQLARDIAEIERARDALLATGTPRIDVPAIETPPPVETAKVVRILAWTHLRRTADSVPVILGSVVGVLMLVVFSAAAAFVRLAR